MFLKVSYLWNSLLLHVSWAPILPVHLINWFLTGGNFVNPPKGHLAIGDISLSWVRGCHWELVGRGSKGCETYWNAQASPHTNSPVQSVNSAKLEKPWSDPIYFLLECALSCLPMHLGLYSFRTYFFCNFNEIWWARTSICMSSVCYHEWENRFYDFVNILWVQNDV